MSEPKSTNPRLTTATVLRDISPAELSEFVASYAAKNRQFASELKTHFALRSSAVASDDSLENVLLSALRGTSKGSKRGKNVWELYQDATNKILQQVTSDQQSGDLTTTLRAVRAIIKTLPEPTKATEEDADNPIAEILTACLRRSKEFTFLAQAPEAKTNLLEIWSEANWLTINHYELLMPTLRDWLLPLASSLSEGRKLTEAALKQATSSGDETLNCIAIWLSIHFEYYDITQQLEPDKHAPKVGLWSKKHQLYQFGMDMLQYVIQNYELHFFYQQGLHHLRYFLADSSNSPAGIKVCIEESRWACLNNHSYRDYLEYEKRVSPEEAAFLFAEIDAQPDTVAKQHCIAEILAHKGRFDELLHRLSSQPTNVIHQYHQYLLPRFGGQLYLIYLDWLQSRLVGYIGPIPAAQIQNIVAELKTIAPEFAQALTTDLINNNPGRIALHNQLNELWTEDEN